MSKTGKRLLAFIPALLWYGVIWRFSAQTATQSGGVSGGLLHTLLQLISPAYTEAVEEIQVVSVGILSFFIRKAAHISLYFVLTALLLLALSQVADRTALRRGAALALCALLAGLDEYHQTFVPGRSGELRDVCIDTAGGGLFLLLWAMLVWLWRSSGSSRRPALLMGSVAGLWIVLTAALPWGLGCCGLPWIQALAELFVDGWDQLSAEKQCWLAAGALPVAAQSLRICLAGAAVCFVLLADLAAVRYRKR